MTLSRFLLLACVFGVGFATSSFIPRRDRPRSALEDATPSPAVATVVTQGPLPCRGSLPVMLAPLGDVKEGDGLIKVTILDEGHKSEAYVVVPATGPN